MWNKSKYKNVKQTYDGRSFDSGYERKVYDLIKTMEHSNQVRLLRQECTVRIHPEQTINYRADYEIEELIGDTWHRRLVEAKGFETPEWKIKLKLYRSHGPCPLWLFKGMHHGQPKLIEIIIPKKPIANITE